MKISVCVMAIMVMCICPGRISEERDLVLEEQRRPKDCRFPKGKHGSVRNEGCVQNRCNNGKWKAEMRTDICCYKQKVHRPNTILDTIVSADNCSTTIECGAVAQLEVKPSKCSVPATKQEVEDLSNQVARKLEHQAEQIDNLTMMMKKNIDLMEKLTSNGLWESVVPMNGLEGELPPLFDDNCCTHKSVGGVGYTQVAGSTDGYDCDGQCVYEKDGMPGSRTCFKSGGPAPLPAQCTASFIGSAYVSIVRNSEDIIFKTDIGTFTCTVGSATTEGENIECSEQANQEAGSGSEKAAFWFSKSPVGKSEWMCLHTISEGIHCNFEKTLKCHYVPPSVGEPDKLFVEGAQNVTGHDLEDQIRDCQTKCNRTTSCTFWTLSFAASKPSAHEHGHGHRFHQGHSECGIRNYDPRKRLPNINKDQFTGLRNSSKYFRGSVFVFDFFPSRSPRHCLYRCKKQKFPNCTTWTWQANKEKHGVCAINVYTPIRKIDISTYLPKPNLQSGCFQENGSACRYLPPKVDVMLSGGDGYSTGNVFAVNSDGFFGPVCDDGWNNVDASVVCRQLGFKGGNATTNSYFGSVPSKFAMDNVDCQGEEDTIQQCSYLLTDDCSSAEGAGAICST